MVAAKGLLSACLRSSLWGSTASSCPWPWTVSASLAPAEGAKPSRHLTAKRWIRIQTACSQTCPVQQTSQRHWRSLGPQPVPPWLHTFRASFASMPTSSCPWGGSSRPSFSAACWASSSSSAPASCAIELVNSTKTVGEAAEGGGSQGSSEHATLFRIVTTAKLACV